MSGPAATAGHVHSYGEAHTCGDFGEAPGYIMGMEGTWQQAPVFELGPDTRLIPLALAHAPALLNLVQENRNHFRPWLPGLMRLCDRSDARRLIRVAGRKRALRFGIWHGGYLAGVVSLLRIRSKSAFIGYWLDQGHQGLGLVSASVAALCRYAMGELGLTRLVIATAADNRRSRNVAERLGFALERDAPGGRVVYVLTAGDPLPNVAPVTGSGVIPGAG